VQQLLASLRRLNIVASPLCIKSYRVIPHATSAHLATMFRRWHLSVQTEASDATAAAAATIASGGFEAASDSVRQRLNVCPPDAVAALHPLAHSCKWPGSCSIFSCDCDAAEVHAAAAVTHSR